MNLDKVLDYVVIAVWLLLFTFVTISFIRNVRQYGWLHAFKDLVTIDRIPLRRIFLLLLAIFLSFLSASLIFIMPEQVGVVVSALAEKGYRDRPLTSGLNFVIPMVEQVHRYPIYWQTYTMSHSPLEGEQMGDDSIPSRTKDGQEVRLDCSVIFRINPNQVVRVHIAWQNRYTLDLVRARTRGLLRSLVAKYTVDEVNSIQRGNLETEMNTILREILEDEGFELNTFVLRNIAFTPEYALAVEAKQVAFQGQEQRAYEAEQIRRLAGGRADEVKIMANAQATAVVIQAQADADARFIKASSESRSLKVINQAVAGNFHLLTYEYIQKLAPGIKVMLVPSNAPVLLPLPTDNWLSDGSGAKAIQGTGGLTQTLVPFNIKSP